MPGELQRRFEQRQRKPAKSPPSASIPPPPPPKPVKTAAKPRKKARKAPPPASELEIDPDVELAELELRQRAGRTPVSSTADASAAAPGHPHACPQERAQQAPAVEPSDDAGHGLPEAWRPYPWQARVLDAYARGIRRFYIVVHRRAGKDQVTLNLEAIASQERVGAYRHVFPYANQVRDAIWNGMDKADGRRFIDQAFPHRIRAGTWNSLMQLPLKNGSHWGCIGSDNKEALRGGNPVGVTFSEWAFCHPDAWNRVAPIIRENGGWAAFITTPAGKNHAFRMFERIKNNPKWHVEYLTVDDTTDCDGRPLITREMIDAERADGMDEAEIQREYYCRWDAPLKGAYFSAELELMRGQGRIAPHEYQAGKPVFAVWKMRGASELVALLFQPRGIAHYCIGSAAWEAPDYAAALHSLPAVFPWATPATVTHLIEPGGAGARAFERARGTTVTTLEAPPWQDGIPLTRALLPTVLVDDAPRPWAPDGANAVLIEALGGYRAAQDASGALKKHPADTWEAPYAEALALYAAAVERDLLTAAGAWGPAPNYAEHDRGVI